MNNENPPAPGPNYDRQHIIRQESATAAGLASVSLAGSCDTPMLRRALNAWNTDFEKVSADYPVKRIIQPEEIARAVMFLASDDATAMIGTDRDVTAGSLTK